MEIALRDKNYNAEHLTDLNYLALGNLFIDDSGNFSLTEVENYESLSQSDKLRLTKPIMKRLIDPKEKAAIASSLSAIFPSLPRELVSYRGEGDFTLNITLEELLRLSLAVANAVGNKEMNASASATQALEEITPVQEATIVRLWGQIETIERGIESNSSNIEILNAYKVRVESILEESENYRVTWNSTKSTKATSKLPSKRSVAPILDKINSYLSASIFTAAQPISEIARAAHIARLEEELVQVRSGKGFGRTSA
ncbi:hypothetical protein [Nostoc sp.]|uniref:hypothetical protein n=1 Tax=Nostoc sp. TaxID=1180 RepID=UPI002FF70350